MFSLIPKRFSTQPLVLSSISFRTVHSSSHKLYPRNTPWKSLKTTVDEVEAEDSKPWDYNKSEHDEVKDLFSGIESKPDTADINHDHSDSDHSFHVQRPFQSETDATTATEKERLIFTKILDSILYQRDKGKRKSGSVDNSSKSISSSLQALFESNDNLEQISKSSKLDNSLFSRSNHQNVKLEIATEDVRKMPLSYSSLIQKDSSQFSQSKSLQIQQKERENLLSIISPILDYVDDLQTDQEVVDYYVKNICDKFTPDLITVEGGSESVSSSISPTNPATHLNPPLTKQYLPFYLLKSMQVLCKSFDDPSEAISLFELSKRVGIEFYACTCSVDVYNEMLSIRWQYFRDLYAVESLVSEMHVNAVQGNDKTVDILGSISRDCVDAKHGILGINGVPLWTKEDDERVKKLNQYRLRITANLASLEGFTIPFST